MMHFSPIHKNSSGSIPLPCTLAKLEEENTRLISLFDECLKALQDEIEEPPIFSFSDEDKIDLYSRVQTTLLPTLSELSSVVTALGETGLTKFQEPFIRRCQQLILDYLEIYKKLGGPFKHQCWLVQFDIEFTFYLKDPTPYHLAKARALLTEYEEKMLNPLRELAQTMPEYRQDFDRYKTYFDLLSHLWASKSLSREGAALDLTREILQEHEGGTSLLSLCIDSIAQKATLLQTGAETKVLELSMKVHSLLLLFSQESPNLFSLLSKDESLPSSDFLPPFSIRDLFDFYIGKSPKEKWYRFFIDYSDLVYRPFEDKLTIPAHLAFDYPRGWKESEEKIAGELGYFEAMCNGFSYIRETLGKRFSSREFELLHDKCIAQVQGLVSPNSSEIAINAKPSYPIKWSDVTEAARRELEEHKLIYDETLSFFDPNQYVAYLDRRLRGVLSGGEVKQFSRPDMPLVIREHASEQSVREQIDRLFETYYAAVQGSEKEERLKAIVNLCRGLEILHAFRDGNQRTIAFALLTKLLLENGFPPAIIIKPEMFDGYYSTEEMVLHLYEGMNYYIHYEWR